MRKLIVLSMLTLDGVMQAPGGKEEDREGGFEYGGWSFSKPDSAVLSAVIEQVSHDFDLLFGRKTFHIFEKYWPHGDGPIAVGFNKAKKYVATRSPLKTEWKNSFRIEGELAAGVQKLKNENGPELQVHGSPNMIQTLMKNDLVDEFWFRIFPVTIGKGKKLFAEGTIPAAFELTNCTSTPSGVILANYRRNGDVKTGTH
jgi:dihydrofolate reductase